jgi:hypothetical protein
VIHPPWNTTFSLWEGTITAGTGRDLEPWFANIFTLGLVQQYDQNSQANNLLGFDVTTRIKRTQLFGSVLLDDIQVDQSNAADNEPPSYGFTLGAQGGIARIGWTAFYTQVTNLTYRTPNPAEAVMRRNVGLGRNFADYDQLTLRGSLMAGPGAARAGGHRAASGPGRSPPPLPHSRAVRLDAHFVRAARHAHGPPRARGSGGAWALDTHGQRRRASDPQRPRIDALGGNDCGELADEKRRARSLMPDSRLLSRDRLEALLRKMATTRIVVVGDAMLDVYLVGDADRVSPEAPVPVVTVHASRHALGGAANVAANVRRSAPSAGRGGRRGRRARRVGQGRVDDDKLGTQYLGPTRRRRPRRGSWRAASRCCASMKRSSIPSPRASWSSSALRWARFARCRCAADRGLQQRHASSR